MPIDIEKALGAELPPLDYQWSDEDVILYNIAVGAGDPPTDDLELRYAYESDLQAVPTFATIPPFGVMMSLSAVEGVDVDLAKVLHGDQELTLHRPVPTAASVRQRGQIVGIYDKGSGALVVIETVSTDAKTGEQLFTNRAGVFVRGEGGFGGEPGPRPARGEPDRPAEHLVESETLSQQALLYRMASGDKNPLHADPGFAMFAGFERPILHGLCTYGIVAKAAVDAALGGQAGRLASYVARFAGHVYPGETLVTSIWEENGGLILSAQTKERGSIVLSNGSVDVR